ncbi:MAG: hypothetical protein SFV23_01055 [Planctomycetaceae bacterium]|nr:hypothetical protein [Planctomycetaceae bacterium]
MVPLVWALAWLTATFAIHVVWWRNRPPRSQTVALLGLFGGSAVACLAGAQSSFTPVPGRLTDFSDLAQLAVFQVAMTLAYVEAYTAIEDDSPSMTILLTVAATGARGCVREELQDLIPDEAIVGRRLQALIAAGLVHLNEDRLSLSHRGMRWARRFQTFRRLYGLPLGG